MRGGLLRVLLFLAAAAGVALLGGRIVASERASAERTAREVLRARAQEAAGTLSASASRLLREAATGTPDAVREIAGPFRRPDPPRPLRRLEPDGKRDPEATFYLDAAGRAETVDRDSERAAGLYRAAAGEGRDPAARSIALHRLAALERRRGREVEAATVEREFLASVDPERRLSVEALLVRVSLGKADSDIARDVLRHLATGSDPEVRGLLRACGAGEGAIRARWEEIGRIGRLKEEDVGVLAAMLSGVLVKEGDPFKVLSSGNGPEARLLAFAVQGDTVRFREEHLPPLPAGTRLLLRSDGPGADPEAIEEVVTVPTGEPLWGQRVLAAMPRATIDAAARRGALLLGGALAALLLAGGAAFALSVRAARREAEAAHARAAFVTKVGHDLRTPLAVVRMYAETLAAGKVADPAEAREFAGIAAREAERLTGMVGQVLDLSRVSEGEGALARRPLDLAELAREVVAVHRPLLLHAGMRLEVRAEGPLPVLGDSAALRGAVSNLLENTARHASSGGEVGLETAREGRMAVLRVLDRGPGIPAGMEERLFERFVRGPDAAGPGAGLGLAFVREAAEAHGGQAAASNRSDGGAVFTMSVPLGEEREA